MVSKMLTIGKVKSEYTLTGPRSNRSGTGSPVSPRETRIPVAKATASPVTVFQTKKCLPRRKLHVGDAKSQLGFGSPAGKVKDIKYEDEPDKRNTDCRCDPELKGDATLHPNCTFVNVCSEHLRNGSRRRWHVGSQCGAVGRSIALFVVVVAVIVVLCNVNVHTIYWFLRQHWERTEEDEFEEATMYYEEPEDDSSENELIELNPKMFGLTESKHNLSLLELLAMTLERFFGWIGSILLPIDE
ncbi:uncharacterized protein LOC120900405 isoform X2 [Anopheles arabiensis]|uniref:uncharacterized protein LOC120900405 isoform X2 n=1 Tax=Anopheles arabiensis TaxID=7173 RepID=UPI001AADE530|nr:uncharacterized protein LOC120900405 isoform X2 [Anopheles arabiensis]